MKESKVAPIEIRIDASEVISQINELIDSLKLKSTEGISEHIVNLLFSRGGGLFDYIVFSDSAPTVSATNVNEITVKVKIIGSTDEFAAALRACDFDVFCF
ncbi:TPA: hypothetical protein ACQ39K_000476 [Yersinia enterocolitica]